MAQEEVLGSLITSITYRVTTKNDFISMVYTNFYVNVKELVTSSNGVARGNGNVFLLLTIFSIYFNNVPRKQISDYIILVSTSMFGGYHRLTQKHFTDYFTNQYLSNMVGLAGQILIRL